MMKEIPIVLGMDSKSIPNTFALINSIRVNVPKAYIYIITDEPVDIGDSNIDVICADIPCNGPYSHISGHTYYRLMIDKLIPSLEKCIYLDYDTIVLSNIGELISGDSWIMRAAARNNETCFNAGVLAFNFTPECRELMEKARSSIKPGHDDQQILHEIFEGKVDFVGIEYNMLVTPYTRDEFELHGAKILHFIGSKKPWEHDPRLKYYYAFIKDNLK